MSKYASSYKRNRSYLLIFRKITLASLKSLFPVKLIFSIFAFRSKASPSIFYEITNAFHCQFNGLRWLTSFKFVEKINLVRLLHMYFK